MEDFIQNRFGYCFYEIKGGTALIYNLYVHPEHRLQGKARRLLQLVISEIIETGYDKDIKIEVAPRENSIQIENLNLFYKRMGLKIVESIGK